MRTNGNGAAATVDVVAAGSDGIQVKGSLTFATARRAREAGLEALEHFAARDTIVVDCSGVGESDSAGLAVLIDWMAKASAQGRTIQFANLPPGITAAARISEVDGMLGI